MSRTDGNFSDEEKAIIDTHCIEMHIDNNSYECELPLEGVLSKISSEFSEQEKRIVFLELAATVLADKVYHTTHFDQFLEEIMQRCFIKITACP